MTSDGVGTDRHQKSAQAFKTISEVARTLDVPQHVLRFWETKFNHIKPMKRAGGRRYYRPEDVDLLSAVRQLLHADGYTIRGVQKMMREKGVKVVMETAKNGGTLVVPAPAVASVTISATNKISDHDKSELVKIRDELLAIRAGLVGAAS